MAEKFLIMDMGETNILYMVVTGQNPIQSINNLARDMKNGSALQLGNSRANYTFHKTEIIDKAVAKCKQYKVDKIVLNLPSEYDNLVLIPSSTKKKTLEAEIQKADMNFDTKASFLVYSDLKRSSDVSITTAVSKVNKEYLDIIDGLREVVDEVCVMTSFTRLQLIADDKVDKGIISGEQFAVIDSGYSGTRGMVFDEDAIPRAILKSTLAGRDIVEKMQGTDTFTNDSDFSLRQNLNDGVKSYINGNAYTLINLIKSQTKNNPCTVFMYGGLSTLPWAKVCKEYTFELGLCEPVLQKNRIMAVKTALMFQTPFKSCKILTSIAKPKVDRSRTVVDLDSDSPTEEEYIQGIKNAEDELNQRKPVKPAKPAKKVKPAPVELEEDEEEPVSKKPAKKPKKQKAEPVEEEEYEEDEAPKKQKKKSKKKSKQKSILDYVFYGAAVLVIVVLCFFTYSMYTQYQKNSKQVEIEVTDQKANLTTYVQKIVESKGIKVSSCKAEVIGDKNYLYLGFTDIDQTVLDDLLQTLDTDCDAQQSDVVYGENNTISLTLTISFK